jgi:photosystem II stability/assembly factor-like uncharacterized protein
MKKLILVLLVFVLSQNGFSQWTILSRPGVNNSIIKLSQNNILIFNTDSFLKSTDGGVSWGLPQVLPYSIKGGVKFVDSLYGWAMEGGNGTGILRTTNGGNNWQKVVPQNVFNVNAISFIDRNNGVGVGNSGLLLRTSNGGVNWSVTTNSNLGQCLGVCMINSNKGFAYSNEVDSIFKTTNGGITWKHIFLATSHIVDQMMFLDDLNGYCISKYSNIFKTTDGGETWINYSLPYTGTNYDGLFFINVDRGFAYDRGGKIYMTTNGASSWTLVRPGPNLSTFNHSNSIYDIYFKDINTGWTLGNAGRVLQTTNGGINWFKKLEPPANIVSVFFKGETTGFILASTNEFFGNEQLPVSHIYKTTNRGVNWVIINSFYNAEFTDFKAGSSNNLFLCGTGGRFYRSTDNGTVWDSIGIANNNFRSLSFIDDNTGSVCGDSGKILKTTNGGLNWTNIPYPHSNVNLKKVQQKTLLNIFVMSHTNFISVTTNGGLNWNNNSLPSDTMYIADFNFIDNNTGYRSAYAIQPGPFGSLVTWIEKTTNTGASWITKSNSYTNPYTNILFEENGVNGFLSQGNMLRKTLNGGENWSDDALPVQAAMNTGWFVNSDRIYLGSNSGTLVTNYPPLSVWSSESELTPISFLLFQNYPNPFNPSTVIRYQLSVAGFTTLKVFDLLGKEVASLVNERQNTGSYAVDFNSAEYNLPSGIYFYTLNAGEFKETRKMVLVK